MYNASKIERQERSPLMRDEHSIDQDCKRGEGEAQGRHRNMKHLESIPLEDRPRSPVEHQPRLAVVSEQSGSDVAGHGVFQRSPKHSPDPPVRLLPTALERGKKKMLRDKLSLKINKPLHDLDSVASEIPSSARGTPKRE